MTIRKMTPADAARAAQIERETFSLPWSENAFGDAVRDENALFLAADENGLVGYILMYLTPPEGEITNVAVTEACRGRGIGGRLVGAMQEEAAKHGIDQIYLEVRFGNAAAIHVYESAGFREIGVRRGFYEFPREDVRVMKWEK